MADSTIGAGQDWPTPAAWEAGTQGSLPPGEVTRGLCAAETFSGVSINGATGQDATTYRELTSMDGAQWDPVTATGAYIEGSPVGEEAVVLLLEPYARVVAVAVDQIATEFRGVAHWRDNTVCSRCYVTTQTSVGSFAHGISHMQGDPIEATANIITGSWDRGINASGAGVMDVVGNSLDGAFTRGVSWFPPASSELRNNAIIGAATCINGGGAVQTSNATSDATGQVTNVVRADVWTDPDNGDYSVIDGSDLHEAGTTPVAGMAPDVDYYGNVYQDPRNIGAVSSTVSGVDGTVTLPSPGSDTVSTGDVVSYEGTVTLPSPGSDMLALEEGFQVGKDQARVRHIRRRRRFRGGVADLRGVGTAEAGTYRSAAPVRMWAREHERLEAEAVAEATFTAVGASPDITITAHGFGEGDGPFRLSTDTTLPAGLSDTDRYWASVVDANTVNLYTGPRKFMAFQAPAVVPTDAGAGVHTIRRAIDDAEATWHWNRRNKSHTIEAETTVDNLAT